MAFELGRLEPEYTMRRVFEETHDPAQQMVDALDEMRTSQGIDPELDRWVPGYNLYVDFQTSNTRNGGQTHTRTIGARTIRAEVPRQFPLLGVSRIHRADGILPIRVEAYRGREKWGDYAIAERGHKGEIVTRLSTYGDFRSELPDEPFGRHSSQPEQTIGEFNEEELARIQIVRVAIFNTLNAVQLVLNGATVDEIFAGRHLPEGGRVGELLNI